MAQPLDYSIKAQVPMAAIIQAYQNKVTSEHNMKMQQEQLELNKFQQTLQTFQVASGLVKDMTAESRLQQQSEALNGLSSLVKQGNQPVFQDATPVGQAQFFTNPNSPQSSTPLTAPTGTPTEVPLSSTPDFKFQLASLMTKAAPDSITAPLGKSIAKSIFPEDATGTPPRSFESYLIKQVNEGNMTPEEAADQLSRMKPSNVVIGYNQEGQPIYSNTRSTTPSAQPLPAGNVPGGVFEKPERVSETELGKQADIQNLRIAAESIDETFDPSFVGAMDGRLNELRQMNPETATEKRAQFMTSLASYKNSVIKAITGVQMSETEAARIMRQLPDEKMSETDFKAKLKLSRELLEAGLSKRQKQLQRGGFTGVPDMESPKAGKSKRPSLDSIFGGL